MEYLLGRADLHDATRVHDRYLGYESAYDGEVVAHIDGGHPIGPAHRLHRFKHVSLCGHVEACRRLVENDD